MEDSHHILHNKVVNIKENNLLDKDLKNMFKKKANKNQEN